MANKVVCALLTPSFFANLSSGWAFSAMNLLLILQSSDALTIFSMSSNEVDFAFMMFLLCRFHRQNKNKTLPFSGRVGKDVEINDLNRQFVNLQLFALICNTNSIPCCLFQISKTLYRNTVDSMNDTCHFLIGHFSRVV